MEEVIQERIAHIRNRIRKACLQAGRSPEEVRLLLATKTVSPQRIKSALACALELIAENKIQELREKSDQLKSIPHKSHFNGHLQSNKVKDLIRFGVECLHSLDRWSLATNLGKRLEQEDRNLNVLIQINTSGEPSKFGLAPQEAEPFIRKVAGLERLKIKGLMTIGLFIGEEEPVRACFRKLREIRDQIAARNIPGVEMKELSMGMSGDQEWAIAEGAAIIRVGTAVFGPRPYPDHYYWNEENASEDRIK